MTVSRKVFNWYRYFDIKSVSFGGFYSLEGGSGSKVPIHDREADICMIRRLSC